MGIRILKSALFVGAAVVIGVMVSGSVDNLTDWRFVLLLALAFAAAWRSYRPGKPSRVEPETT